jgi:glycosyltransferase involved in cell wall biosynthesis
VRVAFVYPNPREELVRQVASGSAPDTGLLGQNHLAALGIDAYVHDSILRRTHLVRGASHRLTWLTREATLPWELRDADLIVTPLATLLPLVARAKRRPRVLLLAYGLTALWDRAGRARRVLLGASVRAAAAVVTISDAGRERIIRDLGVSPERVSSLRFGVDATFWQAAAPAPSGHVLTVGRDLARDYRTFAQALEGVPARGVIVAKEENLRGVRLPANVEARIGISTGELRALYEGASCVVLPMVPDGDPRGTESSGNTALLEAMACARATVVTERASLHEYLYDDASLVTPGSDPAALREAIVRLVDHPDEAAERGRAARRHIEESHTTSRFAERLAPVIRSLRNAV